VWCKPIVVKTTRFRVRIAPHACATRCASDGSGYESELRAGQLLEDQDRERGSWPDLPWSVPLDRLGHRGDHGCGKNEQGEIMTASARDNAA
jgi:hypothetical protein